MIARLRHRRAELLLVTATMALVAFYYVARTDTIGVARSAGGWAAMTGVPLPATLHFLTAALVLGLVPVLIARTLGFRPSQLGLGWGDWHHGLALVAAGLPLAVTAGAIGAATPVMRSVYPLDVEAARNGFVLYALMQFLYFGAWEVLFRGVLLFGLAERLGGGPANAVQTALSVTAHFGRALTETLAAIPAGLLFGIVGLRFRSVWYVAIIHWAVGVSMDWFMVGR